MVPLLVGGVCGRGRGVCDLLMRFCTQASFKRPIQKGLGGELRGIRRIALSRGYTLQVWEGFFFGGGRTQQFPAAFLPGHHQNYIKSFQLKHQTTFTFQPLHILGPPSRRGSLFSDPFFSSPEALSPFSHHRFDVSEVTE